MLLLQRHMNKQEITRIAPSPTGDMHLGTARTAYFNYLASRSTGGKFILRIDDTDINRNKQEHTDVILRTMEWLGLDYDDIYYQSKRSDIYNYISSSLVEEGVATVEENGGIVIKNVDPMFIPASWHDEISGDIKTSNKDKEVLNNIVLVKGDGMPTYNFCTAVDDILMNVNHIIRGVDHIPNTVKQQTIYNIIKFFNIVSTDVTPPKYTHVGLIHQSGKKLSKRDGAASMFHYKDSGYKPEAMLNFMLRLGWAETDGKTIPKIPKDMAKTIFYSHGKLKAKSSNLDLGILKSINKRYT